MNNAGRTMEKLKYRIGVRLVNNGKNYLKCLSKLNINMKINIWQCLIIIRNSKVTLKLNELVHVGMSILDLSGLLINEFHYDEI